MSFSEIQFQHFITLQRGFDLPISKMKDGDVPVLGSNCIVGYHNEAKVEPPGVVTGRSGTLGMVQFTDKPYWPHNTSLWVKDFKGNDPKFVYYKLQTLKLDRFNGGASVPTLNRNVLDTLKISIPGINKQQKIASILSAYDSLIENNRRRIQLLEQSARLLYREWFVHLRFPGHEHVRIVDGVPERWKIKDLDDIIKFSNGNAIKIDGDGPFPVFGSNGIIGSSDQFMFDNGIIIGRVGAYCGSIERCSTRFWASDNTIVAFPKDDPSSTPFIFYLLQEMKLNNYAGGAAQPLLTQIVLKKIRIRFPNKNLINDFTEIVMLHFKQIDNLLTQIKKLKAARDILLPRLMNGEITV